MAKQLNLLSQGGAKVIPTALHTEMEQSYLEYAMSVIVGRALPDVRDGLKPVHRRILYAMHELGLTPDRPYRKCARVVGDVLGKYHPHGDQSVYDALVRMVQTFSSRYPLLDGHGNFGSVDNDPPAAMRYTETRLSPVAHQSLLGEIGEETVEFMGNFDNSQQEPVVLPSQLPVLLLNGCAGIAVGMATNIPPHNLAEVVDALIALIDRPDLSIDQLLELVPGPDFPTGGIIIGREGIREAYTTGRGSITLRAVAQMEEMQPGRGRHRRPAIIITELPYQVNKSGLIEKIAELINQGRIEGIADLRDESDREGMRIVIELKRETQPQPLLDQLYRQTQLQTNFGVIMLALVDGQPRQMGLKELLEHFLNFREQTLTRRYRHQLDQAQSRLHLVEGLLTALQNLDRVITLLREATDGAAAKQTLQGELNLSDRQADAILSMPLRRLTGLEQQNLRTEHDQLVGQIQQLETLLGSRHELLKALKKDLRSLKRQYADQRLTRIQTEAEPLPSVEELAADTEVTLELSQRGYVRCLRGGERGRRNQARSEGAQANNAKADPAQPEQPQELKKDLILYNQRAKLADALLVFTQSGKGYRVDLIAMPLGDRRDKGVPLVTLLPESAQQESIVAQFLCPPLPSEQQLVLLSAEGRAKRISLEDFAEVTARGLSVCKLKDGDYLAWMGLVDSNSEVAIATSTGRLLRFASDEIPLMGRTTLGQQALRLHKQERLVGAIVLQTYDNLLLVSERGYGKRMPLNAVRLGRLGDLGTTAIQFVAKPDHLAAIAPAPSNAEVMLFTDKNRMAHLSLAQIPIWGKDGSGKLLLNLEVGEKLSSASVADPSPGET